MLVPREIMARCQRRLQPRGGVGTVNCGTGAAAIISLRHSATIALSKSVAAELAEAALLQLAQVSSSGDDHAALKQIVDLL
jgi:geranylgeranyl pyrophosphate synthase